MLRWRGLEIDFLLEVLSREHNLYQEAVIIILTTIGLTQVTIFITHLLHETKSNK